MKAKWARNLRFTTCAKLIDFLKEILHSQDFIDRNKKSASNFTRSRLLPFQRLFLYFINLPKGSHQDELEHFFKALFRLDVPIRFVSKMALSLARKKLKYSAFIELNRHLIDFLSISFTSISKIQKNGMDFISLQ